jgi:hypothetical protein
MREPAMFRERSAQVEAIQWDGTTGGSASVIDWVRSHGLAATYICSDRERCFRFDGDVPHYVTIRTPGTDLQLTVELHDWLIRDARGAFFTCKPDLFEATYNQEGGSARAQ